MLKDKFKNIYGIKTKGGFPTIMCKDLLSLKEIDSDHKFYDEKQDTYYVFYKGFFFCFEGGKKTAPSDFEYRENLIQKGMDSMYKAIFPNSNVSREEMTKIARLKSGLPPERSK